MCDRVRNGVYPIARLYFVLKAIANAEEKGKRYVKQKMRNGAFFSAPQKFPV
jgi:hypothetical protein